MNSAIFVIGLALALVAAMITGALIQLFTRPRNTDIDYEDGDE